MRTESLPEVFLIVAADDLREVCLVAVIEPGKLRHPDGGEILRSQTEVIPRQFFHRLKVEFVPEIGVFLLQLLIVSIFPGISLLMWGQIFDREQPCLTVEDSLYLEEIITVMGQLIQRNGQCPLLHGISIDAESEGPRKSYEPSLLPTVIALMQTADDIGGLPFQTLGLQSTEPGMDRERWDVGNGTVAWGIMVGLTQLFILLDNGRRNAYHQLRQLSAVLSDTETVGLLHHMEDDIVVGRVLVMMMSIPVAGTEMDFDIAHEELPANLHLCIEEVGTGIRIVQSWVDDFNLLTINRLQVFRTQQAVLPSIV